MPDIRKSLKSGGVALLALVVGLGLWPLFRTAYSDAFLAACAKTCRGFGPDSQLAFYSRPTALARGVEVAPNFELVAELTSRRTGTSRALGLQPLQHAFIMQLSLLALFLATPAPWRRRLRGFAIAFVLLHLWLWLRLWLLFADQFADPAGIGSLPLSSGFRAWIGTATTALVHPPAGRFLAPLLIWLIVAFRREDWVSPSRKAALTANAKFE